MVHACSFPLWAIKAGPVDAEGLDFGFGFRA